MEGWCIFSLPSCQDPLVKLRSAALLLAPRRHSAPPTCLQVDVSNCTLEEWFALWPQQWILGSSPGLSVGSLLP